MILCSCNFVTTKAVMDSVDRHKNPTVKMILEDIGWQSNCAVCTTKMVEEIREIMKMEGKSELQDS